MNQTDVAGTVISVFPNGEIGLAIEGLVRSLSPDWDYISISGKDAEDLLRTGENIRHSLGHFAARVRRGKELSARTEFSKCASACMPRPTGDRRYLVVSPSVVPLDIVSDVTGDWGECSIFSHLFAGETPTAELLGRALLRKGICSLEAYLLVCPMAMDRAVPRHMQDIVRVALSLESRIPVEVWIQTAYPRARESLARADLSWLHIDTHGNDTGTQLMLGPSRGDGEFITAEDLPAKVSIPLILVVGCGLTAGAESIGSALFLRGSQAVLGPCAIFQSLGVANSEEGEANWYRSIFESLLGGCDIGTALLTARRAVSGRGMLKFAWLIIGNSFLRFANTSLQD